MQVTKFIKYSLSATALLLIQNLAVGASFDCKKAATYAEKSVCGNALLSKLDEVLGENYKYMSASDIGSGARSDLKATQKKWLKERALCSTEACLVEIYKKRIDEVCEYPVISGVHPVCTSSEEIK